MAVVETIADSNLSSGDKQLSTKGGARPYIVLETVEVAAADDDGSKYIMGIVQGNDRPMDIRVFNDAITGGTDYDIGVYVWDFDSNSLGDAVDIDLFADGLNLSSAADDTFGLGAPNIDDLGKTIHDLLAAASITTNADLDQYALVVTANTVGSAAGTITVRYEALKDA